jgi:hypothetical protein
VVAVDGTYADFPADPRVKLHYLDGLGEREGVLEVKSEDGTTLVFNDVVFNQEHLPGVEGLVFRLIGSSGGPKVTFMRAPSWSRTERPSARTSSGSRRYPISGAPW